MLSWLQHRAHQQLGSGCVHSLQILQQLNASGSVMERGSRRLEVRGAACAWVRWVHGERALRLHACMHACDAAGGTGMEGWQKWYDSMAGQRAGTH